MTGQYQITVQNRRLRYKFTISRNFTILRGDSATGKTTLIDMIRDYQLNGENSGITLTCKKPCVVLTALNWQSSLEQIHDSIVFIDEGDNFVTSEDFASAAKCSDNYFVIATRSSLFNLPYSTAEIYGIRNTSGNRYQGTKRLYSVFYPLYKSQDTLPSKPEQVIVEDSNSGFEFFREVFHDFGIPCISAKGKSNVFQKVNDSPYQHILVIADGAAFGPEIERILSLRKKKDVSVYLPESFEWLILKSDLLQHRNVREILENPADYIESRDYFSWEKFFTALLVHESQGSYLKYQKHSLNPNYLNAHERASILAQSPLSME